MHTNTHGSQDRPIPMDKTLNIPFDEETRDTKTQGEPKAHKLESLKAKRETMQEQDQSDYESRIFQGRDTSSIFKYFKSLRRSKLSPILTWNERLETSKEGRAELLCEYFASITETNHDYSVNEDPHTHGDLSLIISADEISNELSVLDPSKSRGEDKLPASVMK